jgi:hypothetical protein
VRAEEESDDPARLQAFMACEFEEITHTKGAKGGR